jgi:hypothetical protein
MGLFSSLSLLSRLTRMRLITRLFTNRKSYYSLERCEACAWFTEALTLFAGSKPCGWQTILQDWDVPRSRRAYSPALLCEPWDLELMIADIRATSEQFKGCGR